MVKLRLLLMSVILLCFVKLRLLFFPAPFVKNRFQSEKGVSRLVLGGPPLSTEQIIWAVAAAGRYLPGAAHCLPQALVIHDLLGRYGHSSVFQIGVARDERGLLKAHAWVESGGKVIAGQAVAAEFVPLTSENCRKEEVI